jgi:GT2 family glycosyltransferase
MTDSEPGATVIIPTLNREGFLLDTLQDLAAQDSHPLEIMVVDQSEETPTSNRAEEFARRFPGLVKYCRVKFRGLPQARNHGWQNAKYQALIFVDDDIRCGPTFVREHLRTLRQPGVGMVAGGVEERSSVSNSAAEPGEFRFWTATPVRRFAARGEHAVMHVAGCNFSVWRSVLEQAGGVDEALSQGAALYEETELGLRVMACGFRIRFNGSARLLHRVAEEGGCRSGDIASYVGSLAHNRTVLIGRYLRWFQMPTAYLRLFLLVASYAARHPSGRLLGDALRGILRGRRVSQRPRICTDYRRAEKA